MCHTNEIGSALSGGSLCSHFLHNSFHQNAKVPLVATLNHIPVNYGISLIKVCQFAHIYTHYSYFYPCEAIHQRKKLGVYVKPQ